MSSLLGAVRSNSAYAFIAVGGLWLVVAVMAGSALVLWPVLACVLGGVQLKMWPARRLTWAWAVSTAALGLILAAYQVYAWVPYLGGAFSTVAATAAVIFVILLLAHLFLLYIGAKPAMAETS